MSEITPEQSRFYAACMEIVADDLAYAERRVAAFAKQVERLGELIAEGTLVRVGENGNFMYRNTPETTGTDDNNATLRAVASMGPEVRDSIFCDVTPSQVHSGAHVASSLVISSTVRDGARVKGSWIEDSTIGKRATVEAGSTLTGVSLGTEATVIGTQIQNYVIGEKVSIGMGSHLEGGPPDSGCTIGARTSIGAKVTIASSSFGEGSDIGTSAHVRSSSFGARARVGGSVRVRTSKFGDEAVLSGNLNLEKGKFQIEETEFGSHVSVTGAILHNVKGGDKNMIYDSNTTLRDVVMGKGNKTKRSLLSEATVGNNTSIEFCDLGLVKIKDGAVLLDVRGTTNEMAISGRMTHANLALVGKTPIYTPRSF